MRRAILGAFAIVGLTLPSVADARTFTTTAPTVPLVYRYAACIFAKNDSGAQAQITACEPVRGQLEEEAETVFDNFHRSMQTQRRRELIRAFNLLEWEAREVERRNKSVPPIVLEYISCMGDSVMRSEAYRDGNTIDYIPIWRECRENTRIHEAAQVNEDVKYLLHRLEIRGRTVNSALGDWPTSEWDFGLFDLRRLSEQMK